MVKTSSERSRVCRQRKKGQAPALVKRPPKSNIEHVKEYRARQRALRELAETANNPTSDISPDSDTTEAVGSSAVPLEFPTPDETGVLLHKRDGKTNTTEQGVIVKQDHAYASKENLNTSHTHNPADEDPLKILPCDLDKIKTEDDTEILENVEIKMESETEDVQLSMPNNEIDIPEYITNLNEISGADVSGELVNSISQDSPILSDSDFVPKTKYSELQTKFKHLYTLYNASMQENITYAAKISSLTTERNKLRNSMSVDQVKQFQTELKTAQILSNDLKWKIFNLKKENLFLQQKLKEYLRNSQNEETMRNCIVKLKNRLETVVNKAKVANVTQKRIQQNEMTKLETRLFLAIKNLEKLKSNIVANCKLKKLYYDTAREKEKLQKELTDSVKVKYLYEDHTEQVKKQLFSKIKEKNTEINNYKKEVIRLSNICLQYRETMKIQKQKREQCRRDRQEMEQDLRRLYLKEKQKCLALQDKVVEKRNENASIMKEFELMKEQVEKSYNDKIEEKMAKHRQENVALREEIAILKVELEKMQFKLNPTYTG